MNAIIIVTFSLTMIIALASIGVLNRKIKSIEELQNRINQLSQALAGGVPPMEEKIAVPLSKLEQYKGYVIKVQQVEDGFEAVIYDNSMTKKIATTVPHISLVMVLDTAKQFLDNMKIENEK